MRQRLFFLQNDKQVIVLTMIVSLLIALLLSPLSAFGLWAYPLGWLLGAFVGIVGYLSLILEANLIINHPRLRFLIFIVPFFRFTLYGVTLFLAGYLSYYQQFELFNIFLVFAGLFPCLLISCGKRIILCKKGARDGRSD